MDKRITQDDVIYFVIADRFFGRDERNADPADTRTHGGTLDGILDKLDYLLELGVTAIWVTPVYENIKSVGASEPYHYYWPLRFDRIDGRLLDGTRLPDSADISTFGRVRRRLRGPRAEGSARHGRKSRRVRGPRAQNAV